MTLYQVLLLTVLTAPDLPRHYQRDETSVGPLYSWGWTEERRAELKTTIPAAVQRVAARLGKRTRQPFTTVLTPDGGEFRKAIKRFTHGYVVDDQVVGVALPGARILVVRGGIPPGFNSFTETLQHEIAHLVLHEGRLETLPRWFDEGAAMWASGHRPRKDDDAHMSLLARAGGLYSLQALADEFPSGHRGRTSAYLQSFLLVSFLEEQVGASGLATLVERLTTDNFAELLAEITPYATAEFEKRFADWVATRYSLGWSLLGFINLWTVAALLALVAIARSLLRRRRLLRKMEQEERDEEELT